MDISTDRRGSQPWARGRVPLGACLMLTMFLLAAQPARAAEPLVTIAKNTLLGGATGLILGGTLTLVVDEEDRSETVRWGVVIGTFGGFALGAVLALQGQEDLFGERSPDPAQPWAAQTFPAVAAGPGALPGPAPADRVSDRLPRRPTEPLGVGAGWSLRMRLVQLTW